MPGPDAHCRVLAAKSTLHNRPSPIPSRWTNTKQLHHQHPPLPRHLRRRSHARRAFGDRQGFQQQDRARPGRSRRRSLRNTLEWPLAATLETRIEPPSLSSPHPWILGWRPPSTLTGESGVPPYARGCRPTRAHPRQGRLFLDFRIQLHKSIVKRGLARSVANILPVGAYVGYSTSVKIIFRGSAKFLRAFELLDNMY